MLYKFICTDGLGFSTRQNELIELALTYEFKGIEIDMADMLFELSQERMHALLDRFVLNQA